MAYALVTQARTATKQRAATMQRRAARLGRPTPGISARPSTGVVYRTPVYGYTGLAGYNAAGPSDVQTYQQALGFNLFKVVTAPFKAAAKGIKAGVKFVAKHPLEVAAVAVGAPLAVVAAKKGLSLLSKPKAPTATTTGPRTSLTPSVIAEPSTAPKTVADVVRETGAVPSPMIAPKMESRTTADFMAQLGIKTAKDVPDLAAPTWTDALKETVAKVGTDTLATFKKKAINTILSQPGVRDVAERVAGEVVSAQASEAAAAVPSWVLPVGIGVGALFLGAMMSGGSGATRREARQ